MRRFFRWEIVTGFICGVIFSIFSEFALGVPAHIPLYPGVDLPIYSPSQVHIYGS